MLTQNEKDNLVRWNPGSPLGHVESFFLKANHPDEKRAFWIKFTIFSRPGEPAGAVGDVWGIVFNAETHEHVALRNQFPIDDCALGREQPLIEMGPSRFEPGRTRGRLELDGQSLEWDLAFDTAGEPFHHFPNEKLYKTRLPKSKAVSPYPDSLFSGRMVLNGEEIRVQGWPGMQGHNWGEKHTDRYAWGHCNLFEGNPKDTFFEGFSGRVKMGGILIPPVTRVFLRLEGKDYPLLSTKGTFWPPATIRYDHWEFQAEGGGYQLRGRLEADKQDMVGLHYKNPTGPLTHCLNSKLARCELSLYRLDGKARELVHRLVSPHGAALEVAVPEGESHGVRMTV